MRKRILEALKALPVDNVSNVGWFEIGRTLKKLGFPCEVWDEWCRGDERWRPGLCQGYWEVMDCSDAWDEEFILRSARLLGRLPPEEEDDRPRLQ